LGGFKGIVMAKKPGTLVKSRLEEHIPITQFRFSSLTDFEANFAPHIRDD
jgi:hypothetical protein